MNDIEARLSALGIRVPEVLLPAPGIDLEAWAVVACDQFTQDRAYWEAVERRVGRHPSTLRMVLPEIYLEDGDRPGRTAAVRAAMASYLDSGVFAPASRAAVYLERSTPRAPRRRGLVLAVDLDRYEWDPASRPLVRATEGTVRERIPPRMEIRRGAPLESPHVILLVDDPERRLLEGLAERTAHRPAAYSTPLMQGSGSAIGRLLDRESDWAFIAAELERLEKASRVRYGPESGGSPFLFAVGDGNHSLATAKAVWDEYRNAHAGEPGLEGHPARFALVEIENIYDEGIDFEPIHRAVFKTSHAELRAALAALPGATFAALATAEALADAVARPSPGKTRYGLVARGKAELVEVDFSGVSTEPLQPVLDDFVAAAPSRSIDYLHGADETIRVALAAPDTVGVLLPPIGKADLFATVARSGPLPRKSFSMGEAPEKRFYLECRRLFG